MTELAVRDAQRVHGLVDDGLVGPMTRTDLTKESDMTSYIIVAAVAALTKTLLPFQLIDDRVRAARRWAWGKVVDWID